MAKTNKRYDEEYKKNIVSLVENGKSIADIESEYGINKKKITIGNTNMGLLLLQLEKQQQTMI